MEHLIESGTPSLHRAIDVALNVSEGVGILHTAGIVHRDLKPANILIADDGIAAIGDFGSVASISPETGDAPSSRHSIIYKPPESFATSRYSSFGDMYQVAILLYELLGGRLPKEPLEWLSPKERERYEKLDDPGKSKLVDESIAAIAQRGAVADLGSLPFYVPQALRRLLRRQVGSRPDARIASSGDFMNALVMVRRESLDWHLAADGAQATTNGVSIRVTQHEQDTLVEVNRGKGFRRDRTLEGDNAVESVSRCNTRFS